MLEYYGPEWIAYKTLQTNDNRASFSPIHIIRFNEANTMLYAYLYQRHSFPDEATIVSAQKPSCLIWDLKTGTYKKHNVQEHHSGAIANEPIFTDARRVEGESSNEAFKAHARNNIYKWYNYSTIPSDDFAITYLPQTVYIDPTAQHTVDVQVSKAALLKAILE